MKIFVTGATGFLGKILVNYLQDCGHDVVGVGSKACDLTKENSLTPFDGITFDQLYHLAAWVQPGDFALTHQGDIWLQNQKINTNLFSWWKKNQPQAKLITIGTSCSYPSVPNVLLQENQYLEGIPHESVYSYGMTKRMQYVGLESLNNQYKMDYLCLVPNTLYGPGYHISGKKSHFIFDLIKKILSAKQFNTPVVLWGDGHQRRELVYVEDFVDIACKLASMEKNEIINIAPEKDYSIREYAQAICDVVGYDSSLIEYDTTKFVGAKSKCLSHAKLLRLLPETEFTPLEKGIKETVDWFKNDQKQLERALK